MRLISTLFVLGLISLLLASCSDLPSSSDLPSTSASSSTSALPSAFSAENILKIHQGMTSDEILSIFGKPKSISVGVCGRPPREWNCTTWEYGKFPYEYASFTFSGKHDSLILNDFEINRD